MASKAIFCTLPSSSAYSLGQDLNACVIIAQHQDSEREELFSMEKRYNLQDLCWCEGLKNCVLQKNDLACEEYLHKILGTSYDYKVDKRIEDLNNLPPLVCSTNQRPDLKILQNSQILH